jgi:hypothetical protein
MDKRGIGAGAAGRILALAPADQAIIRLDAQDCRIEGREPPEIAAMLAAGRFDGYANPPGLPFYTH